MTTVDLNTLIKQGAVTITPPEPDDVRQSRLRREEADATARRHQEYVQLYATLVALGGLSGLCAFFLITSNDGEIRRWAMAVLVSVVSATTGFSAGQRFQKNNLSL